VHVGPTIGPRQQEGFGVILRLKLEQNTRRIGSSWPSFDERQRTPLFLGRAPFRKLVVLLDSVVLDQLDESVWSKEWLLAGLLTLDLVEVLRYGDDGPPADAPTENFELLGERVHGWAVLGPEESGSGYRSVRWSAGGRTTDGAVVGNAPAAAAQDGGTDAYRELEPAVASERRRADALAAKVAETIGADIFVTEREYLHNVTWNLADGVSYCALDDALAVIGLYLRSQGSFIVSRDPAGRGTHTMNRGLFYWVGARELLPSGWRWFSACVQHSQSVGTDGLLLLGQAVLQRAQRALEVRDQVNIALNKPQNNDTADEALSSLDVVLLLLMGAVDATARVVHSVLGVDGGAYKAGWQREAWLAKVTAAVPPLGAVFGSGTEESHTLTILRLLRNSVHGEALPALAVGEGRRRDRTLVGLPGSQQSELLEAFAALGGDAEWGVEQLVPGRIHADPGILLEQLLPRALQMLNKIMDETPVERLSGVRLEPGDSEPPTEGDSDPFHELNRQSIRWQLGL
jgi:hypothetical protein